MGGYADEGSEGMGEEVGDMKVHSNKEPQCSFCESYANNVPGLVQALYRGVYICNSCIKQAQDLVDKYHEENLPKEG